MMSMSLGMILSRNMLCVVKKSHICVQPTESPFNGFLDGVTKISVNFEQSSDRDINPILQLKLNDKERPHWNDISEYSPATKVLRCQRNQLKLFNGVLYRWYEADSSIRSKWQLVLPISLHTTVLHELHNASTAGHLGIRNILEKARQTFFWYSGSKKPRQRKLRSPLQQYMVGSPMERLFTDI